MVLLCFLFLECCAECSQDCCRAGHAGKRRNCRVHRTAKNQTHLYCTLYPLEIAMAFVCNRCNLYLQSLGDTMARFWEQLPALRAARSQGYSFFMVSIS